MIDEQTKVVPATAPARRLLKLEQVKAMTGLGHSFIYEKMGRGEFPAAVKLGRGIAVSWYEDEVQAWINSRPRATRPGAKIWTPPTTADSAESMTADTTAAQEPEAADAPRLSRHGKVLGRPSRRKS